MLRRMLQDASGFIAREKVNGALFKAEICSIPDKAFSANGLSSLTKDLGVSFSDIVYVTPRMDTPCMYGTCTIQQDTLHVESHFTWKELKKIKRSGSGIFVIHIEVESELSALPKLLTSLQVENMPLDCIKMSPVVKLLNSQ